MNSVHNKSGENTLGISYVDSAVNVFDLDFPSVDSEKRGVVDLDFPSVEGEAMGILDFDSPSVDAE